MSRIMAGQYRGFVGFVEQLVNQWVRLEKVGISTPDVGGTFYLKNLCR